MGLGGWEVLTMEDKSLRNTKRGIACEKGVKPKRSDNEIKMPELRIANVLIMLIALMVFLILINLWAKSKGL